MRYVSTTRQLQHLELKLNVERLADQDQRERRKISLMAVVTGFYKSTMCDDVRHVARLSMLEFAAVGMENPQIAHDLLQPAF